MTKEPASRNRRSPAALALIAIISLISACGSTAPANSGTGDATHQKAVKFAECMRANGVSNFPDPAPSGSFTLDAVVNGTSLNPDTPAWRTAVSACKALEPSGFTGHQRSAQQQQAALKFAECVRQNGVPDFPDPTPNGPLIDTNRIPSAKGRGGLEIPGLTAAAHKCTAIYAGQLGLQAR